MIKQHVKVLIIAAVFAVLWLISAAMSGLLGVVSVSHAKFVYYIHTEQFERAAQQVMAQGNADGVKRPNGVKDIDFYDTKLGCVDFYMSGAGLVPASSYWGVIYATEDEPVGFQGIDLEYIRDGEGWYWQEENGDNHCSVTKLSEHWYLYQMWF